MHLEGSNAEVVGVQAIWLDGLGDDHYSVAKRTNKLPARKFSQSKGAACGIRNLERNIRRVEAFVERWKQLSQFLDRGFQGQGFAPEEEAAFLDLKSAIAQDHELLMTTLSTVAERDDKALKLLNAVPSLQLFKELPE